MSIAATAADLQEIRTLVAELPEQPGDLKPAFEALYRVSSRDRTHLASRRIFTSIIDDRRVWTEQSD